MNHLLLACVVALSVGVLVAQDTKKNETFKDRYNTLSKQYRDELEPFLNPKTAPKTKEEIRNNSEAIKKTMGKYSDEFLKLATTKPKDDLAFECSVEAFSIGSNAQKKNVTEFWLSHCSDNSKVIATLEWVAPYEEFEGYGDRLAQSTKSRSIKGMALFYSAATVVENLERAPGGPFDNGKKPVPVAEHIKKVDAATKQIRFVLKEYGTEQFKDSKGKDVTIAEVAKKPLYRAEHLALSRVAPDFEAESLTDGKKHKLSDYRGKIVVLDFYNYFGGYTHDRRTVLPALKRTAEKYKADPVQILSINLDEKKDSTVKLFENEKLSWPQLWDGNKKGLQEIYQVPAHTRSTPYILDAKGVIRAKHKWGADVDAVVVDLLKEMDKK